MNHNLIDGALALDSVSIQHKIDLRPVQARRVAYLARGHGVGAGCLRQLIRGIDHLIPPMDYPSWYGSPPNPNHGKPHHWYTIGKEYSRVLYLNIVKTYLDVRPPYQFDWDNLTRQLDALAIKYGADEHYIETETETEYVYRFWWD